jgi:hypothetical protein
MYGTLADLVVIVHAAFVAFVVIGGLLVLRWPRLAWVHIPAAVWGALIEFAGWICPLTPLENSLRARAGEAGYAGGFVEHYILPVLYPAGLTRTTQYVLGTIVLVINIIVYTILLRRRWRRPTDARPTG